MAHSTPNGTPTPIPILALFPKPEDSDESDVAEDVEEAVNEFDREEAVFGERVAEAAASSA